MIAKTVTVTVFPDRGITRPRKKQTVLTGGKRGT